MNAIEFVTTLLAYDGKQYNGAFRKSETLIIMMPQYVYKIIYFFGFVSLTNGPKNIQ